MKISYYWSKFAKKIRGKAIKNSIIDKTAKINAGSHIVNSSIDKYSYCGYDCQFINADIGSYCSIASNVIIGGHQHPMEWVSTSPVFREGRDSIKKKYSNHQFLDDKRTIISHDVWIGERALIKQGVTIGIGAVVGMGSVVTKDIEPYSIVGGCPARVIRKRFDNETIAKLLESEWWSFDDEQITKYATYFNNPRKFLSEAKIK